MRVFDNRVLIKIFRPKRNKVTGEWFPFAVHKYKV
jgi:hypothetical protein